VLSVTLDSTEVPQVTDVYAVDCDCQSGPINCFLIVDPDQISKASRVTRQEKLNSPVRTIDLGLTLVWQNDRGEACDDRRGNDCLSYEFPSALNSASRACWRRGFDLIVRVCRQAESSRVRAGVLDSEGRETDQFSFQLIGLGL
jgi:hypothetical protein